MRRAEVAGLMLIAASAIAPALQAETLLGHATYVRDGDTIEVQGVPIRLV
ncbi:hypothetical protein [Thiohalocapsa marina]